MTAVASQTEAVSLKAPPGKFRVVYIDPRDSVPTLDQDLDTLPQVCSYLQSMLAAQRASMQIYDENGNRINRLF